MDGYHPCARSCADQRRWETPRRSSRHAPPWLEDLGASKPGQPQSGRCMRRTGVSSRQALMSFSAPTTGVSRGAVIGVPCFGVNVAPAFPFLAVEWFTDGAHILIRSRLPDVPEAQALRPQQFDQRALPLGGELLR